MPSDTPPDAPITAPQLQTHLSPLPKSISAADIEPPTQIADPRVKRKMKRRFQRDSAYTSSASNASSSSSPPGGDQYEQTDDADEELTRGRIRSRSLGGDDDSGLHSSEDDGDDDDDSGVGVSSSQITSSSPIHSRSKSGQGPTTTTTTSSKGNNNGKQNFIFLGDFVDRGYFSLETFTLLMCLKAKYVFLFPSLSFSPSSPYIPSY